MDSAKHWSLVIGHWSLNIMDLQQLTIFQKIAQSGSFTKAASALHVTQPAVSHQIRSLEEELGQQLIERDRKGVSLTQAGEVLYQYTRRILTLVEESKGALSHLARGESGKVSIAAIGTLTVYVLPDLLYEFRSTHPGIEVNLRTVGGEEIQDMVLGNTVDVGIIGSHAHVSRPDLVTVPLFRDDIVPFVHREHPYAQQGRAKLADLSREPLILLGGWKSWEEHVLSLFSRVGMKPHVHLQLDSIEAVKRMVEKGLGFTILPEVTAEVEVKQGTLVPLRLTDAPVLSRQILLVFHKEKYISAALHIFIETLVKRLGGKEAQRAITGLNGNALRSRQRRRFPAKPSQRKATPLLE
jgi:molybdate transport repressor ModE-like protein